MKTYRVQIAGLEVDVQSIDIDADSSLEALLEVLEHGLGRTPQELHEGTCMISVHTPRADFVIRVYPYPQREEEK